MAGIVTSCIQSFLKLVNSIIGMVGIAMILYVVWMIRVWQMRTGGSPFISPDSPAPWFIYAFLGLGITLCVITCSGHIAAETAHGLCLYCYMVFVFLLLMLEAGLTADVFLNSDWEEDFPEDPTGSYSEFKDFIRANFEMCKWISLSIVSVQGLSILLAMVLKALGPHRHCDSDDDHIPARQPLLNNSIHSPPYVVGDPIYRAKTDAWHVRINDKTNG